ncbi:MAG TPA: hypothetical protein PLE99_00065 [Candidatus Thiothrix moscowensis]|uniref:hypothetical protein n=1 Tax=unclassified Thiothrix TaxID=2636184 RepID=UPI001A1A477D|nr:MULTISPECIES: hypothetical protein [unclassified Thiothrix]MBJ6610809.1 hypothetical protein [Candidatus Thiothrix moscowensis]HRJ51131.1 hypothetical protein [Candidatus Thiothrix moscowensis]HRJ91814.1 hypothetical protein [Candidatus Thiothrix moscowensis]
MARWMMLLFAALTVGAALLTYYNVGLEETYLEDASSVRQGSHGGGFSSGGYSPGK